MDRNLGKSISYVLGATAALLLVPLVAMQLTDEVDWTLSDFVAAAILLAGAGMAYVLLARKARSRGRRVGIGVAVALLLMYVWAELAVGIFTNIGS